MLTKVEAFLREFPFLKEEFGEKPITRVRVSRIDEELLLEFAVRYSTYWSAYSSFRFYDEEGNFLRGFTYNPFRLVQGNKYENLRVGDIIAESWPASHYMAWHERKITGEYELTLYKPPKGCTIESWKQHLRDEASKEYRSTLKKIDSELAG